MTSNRSATAVGVTFSTLLAGNNFGVDFNPVVDRLRNVVSPNTGQLAKVGNLGIDVDGIDGFDIPGAAGAGAFDEGDYRAWAAVRRDGERKSTLVRIDLATGRATKWSSLPGIAAGLAVSPGSPRTMYATTSANELVT
jgi:hypothetical protein